MVPNGALGRRRVMSEGMMMLGHAVKQSVAALNGVKLKHLTDMSGSDFRPVPTLVSAADLARTRTPDPGLPNAPVKNQGGACDRDPASGVRRAG
jgi:hypothetical protein